MIVVLFSITMREGAPVEEEESEDRFTRASGYEEIPREVFLAGARAPASASGAAPG
jgi:hypothetical protein